MQSHLPVAYWGNVYRPRPWIFRYKACGLRLFKTHGTIHTTKGQDRREPSTSQNVLVRFVTQRKGHSKELVLRDQESVLWIPPTPVQIQLSSLPPNATNHNHDERPSTSVFRRIAATRTKNVVHDATSNTLHVRPEEVITPSPRYLDLFRELPRDVRKLPLLDILQRHRETYDVKKRWPFAEEDMASWILILNAPSAESTAELFLSSDCEKPYFLFNEILRRDGISTPTFRRLLVHCWANFASPYLPSDEANPAKQHGTKIKPFLHIVSRLLRYARQLSAPVFVSLAKMTAHYCEQLVASSPLPDARLPPKVHAQLSKIHNEMINNFRLPADIMPFKFMDYNWQAQRILLQSATHFKPSLDLNQSSYRAVCMVLLALRKSPEEEAFAGLLERSWPPWRRERHGIDAERPAHDDLSKANLALIQATKSGYDEESVDRVIRILGGREPDGTPTIHIRSLLKTRFRKTVRPGGRIDLPVNEKEVADEWTAKITATRNVQEAWSAFMSFPEGAGKPTLSMYLAMFQKLVYHDKLLMGRPPTLLPGDGLELFPIDDSNLSEDMKFRLQPPQVDELYGKMMNDGIRPQGRCLALLIKHTRKPSLAMQYLRDSDLQKSCVASLLSSTREATPEVKRDIERIPQEIFISFVHFLCRMGRLGRVLPSYGLKRLVIDPLGHALWLLQCKQSICRPAWNELFKGIAREGVAINRKRDRLWNDEASWIVLYNTYQRSRELGLELDLDGFHFICRGLEKALLARSESPASITSEIELPRALTSQIGLSDAVVSQKHNSLDQGAQLLKDEFRKLGQSLKAEYHLGELVFSIGSPQLHAYVRVLGLCRDFDELKFITQWMVNHQGYLIEEAHMSASGWTRLRRLVVALRVFTDQALGEKPEIVASIAALINQLEGWGGWPTNEEVKAYWGKWLELEDLKNRHSEYLLHRTLRTRLRNEWADEEDEEKYAETVAS